jgi:aryl-alcohol dehydrogenase (NADP+)
MEYTNLGSTGLKVSKICLGMMTYGSKKWREWVLEEAESRPFIQRALEAGINFFDTADVYSLGVSEEILGRALKDFGPAREKVVIATKVFNPMGDDVNQRGLSRKHIVHAIDDSLRRLQVDYVDLYQIHRFDPHTRIEETLEALNDIVRAGKALHIGASSMAAWQFAKMLATSDAHGWASAMTAPIVGASKPHHLDDAIAAVGLHLTDEEVARLEEPYIPHPIAGHEIVSR